MCRHWFASQKVCDLAQAYGSVLTSLITATPEGFSTFNLCSDEKRKKKENENYLDGLVVFTKSASDCRLIISKTLLSWDLPPVMPDLCGSDT